MLSADAQRGPGPGPWAWVPSLYLLQGLPYVVVVSLSVVMYKNLGLSNTDIALYTSWLYLPWVIKPLWSPLVDLFGRKRAWIVGLQFAIGAALATLTAAFATFTTLGARGAFCAHFAAVRGQFGWGFIAVVLTAFGHDRPL